MSQYEIGSLEAKTDRRMARIFRERCLPRYRMQAGQLYSQAICGAIIPVQAEQVDRALGYLETFWSDSLFT